MINDDRLVKSAFYMQQTAVKSTYTTLSDYTEHID